MNPVPSSELSDNCHVVCVVAEEVLDMFGMTDAQMWVKAIYPDQVCPMSKCRCHRSLHGGHCHMAVEVDMFAMADVDLWTKATCPNQVCPMSNFLCHHSLHGGYC